MQPQLPQLWLLDLRPLLQDERWRAFCQSFPLSAKRARVPAAGKRMRQDSPARAFCFSKHFCLSIFPYPSRFSGKTTGESRILPRMLSSFL